MKDATVRFTEIQHFLSDTKLVNATGFEEDAEVHITAFGMQVLSFLSALHSELGEVVNMTLWFTEPIDGVDPRDAIQELWGPAPEDVLNQTRRNGE